MSLGGTERIRATTLSLILAMHFEKNFCRVVLVMAMAKSSNKNSKSRQRFIATAITILSR